MELKECGEGKRGRKRGCLLVGQHGFLVPTRSKRGTHLRVRPIKALRLLVFKPFTQLFRSFFSSPLRFQLPPSSFYLPRQIHPSSLCIHPTFVATLLLYHTTPVFFSNLFSICLVITADAPVGVYLVYLATGQIYLSICNKIHCLRTLHSLDPLVPETVKTYSGHEARSGEALLRPLQSFVSGRQSPSASDIKP